MRGRRSGVLVGYKDLSRREFRAFAAGYGLTPKPASWSRRWPFYRRGESHKEFRMRFFHVLLR